MSHPDLNTLLDALRRDGLTPEQDAELQILLASHPEHRTVFEEEAGLNHLLRQIPDAPLSSNFTAQVLESARRLCPARPRWTPAVWRASVARYWLPRLATAAAIVCFGFFSFQHHRQAVARQRLARDLAEEISKLNAGASLELLRNFDAIQRLNQVPPDVDRRLIAALQ
jgi:anti-sigma factor RsiW